MIIGSENDELYPIYLYTQSSSHENPATKEKIDFQAELVKGTYPEHVMICYYIIFFFHCMYITHINNTQQFNKIN